MSRCCSSTSRRKPPARSAAARPRLSPEASRALGEHLWPGHVGELRQVAERLALVHPGEEILTVHLPREIASGGRPAAPGKLADLVAQLGRDVIAQALRRAHGKKILAAHCSASAVRRSTRRSRSTASR